MGGGNDKISAEVREFRDEGGTLYFLPCKQKVHKGTTPLPPKFV